MTATNGLGTYGNGVGTVTPLDMKMAQLGLVVKTAANTIRAGLFWDGSATVVSGKANMSYDVRAFAAVTSRGATAGAVLLTNDAVYNVVTTAAPGSNSRYDVVYVWQREFSLDGTDSEPVIGVVQGTAAASPTVPSLSAYPGAIELARILVPAGVTATNSGTTITQTAPFTALDGCRVVTRTTTEMNSYTPLGAGALAWNIADSILYRYNGSAWKKWESDWFNESNPTVSAQSGSFTSVSATLRAKWTAGTYQYSAIVTITTAGTAAGYLGIPVPVTAARYHVGLAYESAVLANNGVGVIALGGSTILVRKYDGTTLIGSGRTVRVNGTVEV